ncbi:hypothetical protein L873DRAFT_1705212 [Choiromyces venosus 120613-1]|uniref:tRNA(Phe) (4-demethylwyosine(37)-C(7)) aminocarboxypropyltransferase n=1 Tax=Choiromyces venosus 120613-1 TaxID=1336337 RepID=A0A3N4J7Y5_9PEZI|nr:hypothetical protein L873DRAFT_1705212 [Choiromyces venosus 120613-1]
MTSIALEVPVARVREVKVLLEAGGFLAGKIRRGSSGGGCCIVPTSLVGRPIATTTTSTTVSTSDNGDDVEDGVQDGNFNIEEEEREWILQRLGIQNGDGINIIVTDITPTEDKSSSSSSPLQTAITSFLTTHPPADAQVLQTLLSTLPKRYTYTPPLLLLPPATFSSQSWTTYLHTLPPALQTSFYTTLLTSLPTSTSTSATHIALQNPIPAHHNTIRSPRLTPLFGAFPTLLPPGQTPTQEDFENALWTRTIQSGIAQIWAPGYTMFSRGNVKEKARILRFPPPARPGRGDKWVVDMYAGIGYFTFSYLKLGYRVLAWEINHWSVEGLVRGARENGFPARVTQSSQDFDVTEEQEGVVVFLEDNSNAPGRIEKMREGVGRGIERVNLGLLPTSRDSWRGAAQVLSEEGGWVHVHENVGIAEIDGMAGEVVKAFETFERERAGMKVRRVVCEHVERVKTLAPGVMHCVFDIRIGGEEEGL